MQQLENESIDAEMVDAAVSRSLAELQSDGGQLSESRVTQRDSERCMVSLHAKIIRF